MSTEILTLDEIRAAGLKALARELGPVGMVRFLQQFETGRGDYSVERDQWLDQANIGALAEAIRQHRKGEETK